MALDQRAVMVRKATDGSFFTDELDRVTGSLDEILANFTSDGWEVTTVTPAIWGTASAWQSEDRAGDEGEITTVLAWLWVLRRAS